MRIATPLLLTVGASEELRRRLQRARTSTSEFPSGARRDQVSFKILPC
jgi:hypothetical protein